MKISLDWLSDYVTFTESDPYVIAEKITAHTAEVDEVEVQGALLADCCVGQVLTLEKHPNADKLSLCTVKTDRGKKNIVCGGTNLRKGMRVAFAHVGARVRWHGEEMMTLEKTKIRGEASEGMICAAEELDLADLFPDATGHSIIDLGDGTDGVGKSLQEFLGLTDVVLHIDNHAITHRSDLFSHIGFARECVAMGIAKWKKQPTYPTQEFPAKAAPFTFKTESKDLMPRYCACLIEIDGLGETPDWMKRRLAAVGWRPLNLAIDITNYVASEVGVPLHAFDADDIKGTVRMRTAKEGEKIITLDKKERSLPAGAMILSDEEGVFDLLGIMGGLRSSTTEKTRHIYLHSCSLNPVAIRNTVIATGHRTDAATVYEKTVQPVITEMGFYRAVELMLQLLPGARLASKMESSGDNGRASEISLNLARVGSVLGETIPEKEIARILTDLGFVVEGKEGMLMVTPPLWRLGDIRAEHDLIEEIGRIHGFNAITSTMPDASIVPPDRDHRIHQMRDALARDGYLEVVPLSLTGPSIIDRAGFDSAKSPVVENALGEEYSRLQPSLLPALLAHAETNLAHERADMRTFGWAHVFEKGAAEHDELCGLVVSRSEKGVTTEPLLQLKAHLSYALSQAGYTPQFSGDVDARYAHAGRSTQVVIGDAVVGELFEVHPAVAAAFDLPARAAAFRVNLSALLSIEPSVKTPRMLPKFPAWSCDETINLDNTLAGDVLEKIRNSSELLESAEIVDLFRDKSKQNMTVRFVYRSSEKTLTDEEAKKEHAKVMQATK